MKRKGQLRCYITNVAHRLLLIWNWKLQHRGLLMLCTNYQYLISRNVHVEFGLAAHVWHA